jgi:hypothetical protein
VLTARAGAAVLLSKGGTLELIGFLVIAVILYLTLSELNDRHFTAPFSLEKSAVNQ